MKFVSNAQRKAVMAKLNKRSEIYLKTKFDKGIGIEARIRKTNIGLEGGLSYTTIPYSQLNFGRKNKLSIGTNPIENYLEFKPKKFKPLSFKISKKRVY